MNRTESLLALLIEITIQTQGGSHTYHDKLDAILAPTEGEKTIRRLMTPGED